MRATEGCHRYCYCRHAYMDDCGCPWDQPCPYKPATTSSYALGPLWVVALIGICAILYALCGTP